MLTQSQLVLFHQLLVRHQRQLLTGRVERALQQLDLTSVGRALHRLEDGSFGKCQDCGTPLGYLMLVANPVAEQCPDCAGGYTRLRDVLGPLTATVKLPA